MDAHSKWLKVMTIASISTEVMLQKLRTVFATHEFPEILVSDNASCFTSADFKEFMSLNGIKHITSAPYHPASNGLVERAVQTFKNAIRKAKPIDIKTQVSRFLLHYRNVPHTTTDSTPAELLLQWKLRTHLTLMKPDLGSRVFKRVEAQIINHNWNAKNRQFELDDPVFVKNFSTTGPVWLAGITNEKKGPLTFHIELADGRIL